MPWFRDKDLPGFRIGHPIRFQAKGFSAFWGFLKRGAVLALWIFFLCPRIAEASGWDYSLVVGITVAYLFLSYFVHPEAGENIGIRDGQSYMDNPVHAVDDLNRAFLFVEYALLPGRWIVAGLIDAVFAVTGHEIPSDGFQPRTMRRR